MLTFLIKLASSSLIKKGPLINKTYFSKNSLLILTEANISLDLVVV